MCDFSRPGFAGRLYRCASPLKESLVFPKCRLCCRRQHCRRLGRTDFLFDGRAPRILGGHRLPPVPPCSAAAARSTLTCGAAPTGFSLCLFFFRASSGEVAPFSRISYQGELTFIACLNKETILPLLFFLTRWRRGVGRRQQLNPSPPFLGAG